jgi:hypothetical protein
MSKHTQGPWHVGTERPWLNQVFAFDMYRVAQVEPRENQVDNARLIAAAPEMLEALKRAQNFIRNGVEYGYIRLPDPELRDPANQTLPAVEAAIRKAGGE